MKASLFLFLFLLGSVALAASVTFQGLEDVSRVTSSNYSVGSQSNFGEGILFNTYLGDRWSLSTGFWYYPRGWTDTTSGSNAISSQVLQIPLMFNFHLRFAYVGLGVYYAQNQGTLLETGAVNNNSLQYGTYGINSWDYGYLGQLGLHMPITPSVGLQLAIAYTSTLVNNSTGTGTFYNHDIIYIAGVSFRLGEGGKKGKEQPTSPGTQSGPNKGKADDTNNEK